MIKTIFSYLATPGFFHSSPKQVNPARALMDIGKAHSETKSTIKEAVDEVKKESFENVDRQKASQLFENEIARYRISESKITTRYHQHVIYGASFIFLGLLTISLPIIGLFTALNVSIPVVSSLLPVYSYPVLITMFPCSCVVFLVGVRHWYMAKMIALRQRFPFMQYVKSRRLLPNKTEVL